MRIPNPLDDFQSYSVHYVLLACRTTTAAQDFAKDDEQTAKATLTAIDNATYLGSPVKYGNSSRDVFLVLDTRRFAQFSVENLKYDVYVNGLQKGASTSNLAADLSLTILDSVGISFANFMQWLMDVQMETNFDGLVFMLRTIFVGHKDNGATTVVQSETIPMHLNKMDIDLNFAKGAYTMEFMPNMNFDVNRYSRFMTVATATSFNTGTGNNLLGLISSFQDQLNIRSKEYFDKVQSAVKATGYSLNNGQYGRRVNYMITLPKHWEAFQVNSASVGQTVETIFTKAKEDAAAKSSNKPAGAETTAKGPVINSLVSVAPSLGITYVLDKVFSVVTDVAKLGNFQTKDAAGNVQSQDEVVTFYKFITGLTSDDSSMTVHVDVVEFKVPNTLIKQGKNSTSVSQNQKEFFVEEPAKDGRPAKQVPRNFIEYDYIFTGKNLDILNFDMKIQDFQYLLSSNLQTGSAALTEKTDQGAGGNQADVKAEKNVEIINVRRFDPLVLPQDTEAALKNFSQYANFQKTRSQSQEVIKIGQEQTKNLSMFYAMSPTTVALTIRGNPLIMHKFNIGKLGMHQTGSVSGAGASFVVGDNDRQKYRENLEREILRTNPAMKESNGSMVLTRGIDETTYATSPVFCKINIMGPAVDFKTNEQLPGKFATSVLSDNYYVVFKVTNNIQGHSFTQELELYSHSIFGRQKIDKGALSEQFGGKKI